MYKYIYIYACVCVGVYVWAWVCLCVCVSVCKYLHACAHIITQQGGFVLHRKDMAYIIQDPEKKELLLGGCFDEWDYKTHWRHKASWTS